MSKGTVGAVAAGVVVAAFVIGGIMSIERIPAGYVGIIYNSNGGVEDETLAQGWHIVAPWKKVREYSVGIEQGTFSAENENSFEIPTKDGKTITVDMEYSYHFDPEKITDTFNQFKGQDGKDIEETFIRSKLKAWAGEVSATYPVTDIFGDKRSELNNKVQEYVASEFAEYGIVIDSVNFTRIETDAETAEAIQKKVNAQQELELAQIEAETAQVQANKEKEVALIAAEKDKEVALIAAERDKEVAEQNAEAARIRGEGIAASNKAIAESLTPELIERQKYEKWNGELPQVQAGNNASFIVDVPSEVE